MYSTANRCNTNMNKNFLQIRSEVKQSRDGRAWLMGFFYTEKIYS